MTEIDILIVFSYFWIFKILRNNEDILKELKEYLQAVTPYPVDSWTLERASTYRSMNPSDALRLAVSVSPDIEIESIVTWEPSHFAQKSDDRIYIQNHNWGNIWVENSESEIDPDSRRGIEIIPIKMKVYSPDEFFSSVNQNDSSKECILETQNNLIFSLINFSVVSNISESKAEVTLQFHDKEQAIKREIKMPSQGAIYAIIEATNLCIASALQSYFTSEKTEEIVERLRNVIFSVPPARARDMNSEGIVNLSLEGEIIFTNKSDKNIIKATITAYLELVNSIINRVERLN